MKKLNLAIIGFGRSGKDIHGRYCLSQDNLYYNVKYVVDFDNEQCLAAKNAFPLCSVFNDYRELLSKKDIDLVVNASYSDMHYEITKVLLENGFNVLVEKPMARNRYECETLINAAKKFGAILAPFQNSLFSTHYVNALQLIRQGIFGEIKQINIRYNDFARRWDWQTLQKKLGGSVYNTGPHPIGMAMGFLDFDEDISVIYSKIDTAITSGDAEDYAKILMSAPNKPLVDIEISSIDHYCNYNIKIQGTRGTLISTPKTFEYTYIIDGENPDRPVIEKSLKDANGNPAYCSEKLIKHEEKGTYTGTAFTGGTAVIYESVYKAITEKQELLVKPEMLLRLIGIIEKIHADNPLPVRFF